MFDFAYPWVLSALVLAPLLYLYLARWKRQPSVEVPTLAAVRISKHRRFRGLAPIFGSLAFVLLILALARPRFGNEEIIIRQEGIDMVLAIDLSGSMEAIDLPQGVSTSQQLAQALQSGKAAPRIQTAKNELKRFVEERPSDRIGLVGFAEVAYTLSPPTLDSGFLMSIIDNLETGMLGQSTGIAAPLLTGVKRLADSDAPRRVLILFTDGANNVQNRLTPQQAAELAKTKEVIIYTVGIGSSNAVLAQPTLFGGTQFIPAQDEFDEKLLQDIAAISGGRSFRADDPEALAQVMDEINKLEKTSFEQPKYIEYDEYAPMLALAAIALVLLAFIGENTWELRIP